MIYDIYLANQWLFLSWIGVLFVLIGIQIIGGHLFGYSDSPEDKMLWKITYGTIWKIFFVFTILGAFLTVFNQSINWTPRHPEDRNPAEQDRRNFERRINEFKEKS